MSLPTELDFTGTPDYKDAAPMALPDGPALLEWAVGISLMPEQGTGESEKSGGDCLKP
jgi:hypothetical protein